MFGAPTIILKRPQVHNFLSLNVWYSWTRKIMKGRNKFYIFWFFSIVYCLVYRIPRHTNWQEFSVKRSSFRYNNHREIFEATAKFFSSSSQNRKLLFCTGSVRQILAFLRKCSKLNWPCNKLQLNSILLNFIFLLIRISDRKHNHITITIHCFEIGNHLLIAGFVLGDRDKKKKINNGDLDLSCKEGFFSHLIRNSFPIQ